MSFLTHTDSPKSETILVVEDEVVVSLDLQTKLQSLGYRVPDAVRYAEQVEEAVLREQPGLILLDINLKGEMSGIDAGGLVAQRYQVPIVFLTAFADDGTVQDAKKAEPYGFLKKPVTFDSLRLTIEMALEKARMQKQLKASEERLQMVIEGASLGTWDWDITTGDVVFNGYWKCMLGYGADDIKPHVDGWSELVHPDDLPHVKEALKRHLSGDAPSYSVEHRLKTKSGDWLWVLDSGKVTQRDSEGAPLRAAGIHLDIDARKKAERELQQKESYQRALLDNFPFLIWLKDQDSRFLTVNKAFARATGLGDPEQLIFKTDLDVWPRDLAEAYRADDRDVLNQKAKKTVEEEVADQGGRRWFETFKAPVETEEGTLLGTVGFARDVTERKEFEQKLKNNERNLKNFFNIGIDFHWVLDEQGAIVAVNETVEKRLGYQEQDLIGTSVLDVYSPERRDEALRVVQEMLQGKEEYCSVPLRTKSGEEISVETYVSAGVWNGKKAIFGISKDVSRLRLSEEKFSSAFHNNPAIVGLSDVETGQYLEVNRTFLEKLGYGEDDVLGQTAVSLKILSGEKRRTLGEKLIRQGYLRNEEVTLNTKLGRSLQGLLSAEVLTVQGKRYNLTTVLDITERKKAERELEQNEAFLTNVLDSVQDGIDVLDRDLTVIRVNKALEKQYAHNMPLVGKKCYEVFMDRTSVCPWCPSTKTLETGQMHSVELEVPDPQGMPGKKGWVELYTYPLMEQGQVAGVIEYARDITARKSAEIDMKKTYDQLRDILNGIDANVYVASMDDYEILFMNQHMVDEFGEDLTGQTCWQAISGGEKPCQDCTNKVILDDQGRPKDPKVWEHFLQRTQKQYLMHDRAIQWKDGRTVRLQIATDITHIRDMEEQLRQKHKLEAIGVMAGGIAHNFNNSLAIILGNLELAQLHGELAREVNTCLENAKTAIFHSRDLVQQILTYSNKVPKQQLSETVQLEELVDDALKLIVPTIPSSIQLHWTKKLGDDQLAINMNPSQFQEILINLCNNAVKAMGEIGTLAISISKEEVSEGTIPPRYSCVSGRYALLQVRDTGCGMDPDIMGNIFDPFFTTRSLSEGSGMGLATVEGIVKQSGGFVIVDSEPGQGSTFNLYFPAVKDPRKNSEIGGLSDYPRGRESVLFVDDDDSIAELNTQLLGELGYQVTKQTSSPAALELFTKNPGSFDLVITDQTMPELTGKDLILKMKEIKPDVRMILCTGYSHIISKEEALQLGADAYLMKPLNLKKLSHAVREVLDC